MSGFIREVQRFEDEKFIKALDKASSEDVKRVLSKRVIELEDLAVLLSESASNHLEDMAQRAHQKGPSILEKLWFYTHLST